MAAHKAKKKAAPDLDSIKKDFKAEVRHNPDGSWVATIRDPEKMKRAVEAMEGRRRIDRERGQKYAAKHSKERVVNKNGKVVELLEHQVDQLKCKGFRPIGRGGRSAALYFGLSGATRKYVKGEDGLDFVWDDGWSPAPLWYKGTGPQRDPDGNVWVKVNGEWVLEDEVNGD